MSIRLSLVHTLWLVGLASSCQKSTIHLGPDPTGGTGLGGAAGQGSGGIGSGGMGGGGTIFKADAGFGGNGGTLFKADAGFGGNGGGGPPWSFGGRVGGADALAFDGLPGDGAGGSAGFANGGGWVVASGGGGGGSGSGRGGMPSVDARASGGSGGFGTLADSGSPLGDGSIWDGPAGPKWSSCYPTPKCAVEEVLVRAQNTLGLRGCACMANPCSSYPPSCACASSLCGSFAICADDTSEPGVLVCSEKG